MIHVEYVSLSCQEMWYVSESVPKFSFSPIGLYNITISKIIPQKTGYYDAWIKVSVRLSSNGVICKDRERMRMFI